MRVICHPYLDPYFNLAAEEWLLVHGHEEVFMLWRNSRAVIVGRNQNTLAEINAEYVREHNIPVLRRLSGGGAVFHDPGNLNFTCIGRHVGSNKLHFQHFIEPILTALRAMGLPCVLSGRNDILLGDKKISGNAQYVSGDWVLHHGTLLFAAHTDDMAAVLTPGQVKFAGKGITSVRGRVGSIADMLPRPMDMEEFTATLLGHVTDKSPETSFSPAEMADIEHLAASRYRTWEWNYGHSPRYQVQRQTRTAAGIVDAHLDVRHGIIADIRLYGDYFGLRDVKELEAVLRGCPHQREALTARLAALPVDAYMQGLDAAGLAACLA
ncbi:MAG: lipoate--protein ligase [Desulfovibrio sp.]|nr:lipoate--protein ligase [Desulfovibrio sp.]